MFLSGGLDSSIITYLASRHVDTLDTFSVSFSETHDPIHGLYDESQLASEFADILGTNHHVTALTAQVALDLLDDFLFYRSAFAVSSGLGISLFRNLPKFRRQSPVKW